MSDKGTKKLWLLIEEEYISRYHSMPATCFQVWPVKQIAQKIDKLNSAFRKIVRGSNSTGYDDRVLYAHRVIISCVLPLLGEHTFKQLRSRKSKTKLKSKARKIENIETIFFSRSLSFCTLPLSREFYFCPGNRSSVAAGPQRKSSR